MVIRLLDYSKQGSRWWKKMRSSLRFPVENVIYPNTVHKGWARLIWRDCSEWFSSASRLANLRIVGRWENIISDYHQDCGQEDARFTMETWVCRRQLSHQSSKLFGIRIPAVKVTLRFPCGKAVVALSTKVIVALFSASKGLITGFQVVSECSLLGLGSLLG